MVFQSYALFPHMTVADNVAYSLRAAGSSVARPPSASPACSRSSISSTPAIAT